MADIKLLKPIILKWEGGFVNNKIDRGGATNKGITLKTFRSYFGSSKTVLDLKNITDDQWIYILNRGYWMPFKGDSIINQSVANICVDFAWNSGTTTAIKKVQCCLGLKADGDVGSKTLGALNEDPEKVFNKIKEMRLQFIEAICKQNPSQRIFLNGWRNRINYFKFKK